MRSESLLPTGLSEPTGCAPPRGFPGKSDAQSATAATCLLVVLAALAFVPTAAAQQIVRGPYLQDITASSVIVRWRTDIATDSVLRYGAEPNQFANTIEVPGARTDHSIMVSDVQPNRRQYYSVGTADLDLAGGDDEHYFLVPDTRNDNLATRIWILGDSGTANDDQIAVRDAFLNFAADQPANVILMLGDNAYDDGTDAEFQAALFDIYPMVLRNTALWSTLGNHETPSVDVDAQTGVYFDIFDFPGHGGAGGIASGTEAYFSFDYANIHIVSLDIEESDRSPTGPMLTWLRADLAASDKPWTIAIWHRPVYTFGDPPESDASPRGIAFRADVLPILDEFGVDLVYVGHTHAYERSMPVVGHYGDSTTFAPDMIVDSGDGSESGDGAYIKSADGGATMDGVIYTVAGSSGRAGGSGTPHPVMHTTQIRRGSVILDVDNLRLDAVFLDEVGVITDEFTILKTPDDVPPRVLSALPEDETTVRVRFNEHVNLSSAETLENYVIPGVSVLSATRQVPASEVVLVTTPLLEGVARSVQIDAVTDLAGNAVADDNSADFVFLTTRSMSFQDGVLPTLEYAGTRDATISEAQPGVNFGSTADLQVDGDDPFGSTLDEAALIAWDLTGMPNGAELVGATLTLNIVNTSSDQYGVQGLNTGWDENTVTWLEASAGVPWEVAGAAGNADRGSVSFGVVAASPAVGPVDVPLNAAAVTRIQSWLDGADNHGFFIGDPFSGNGLGVTSADSGNVMQRPTLTLSYTLAPADGDADGWPDALDNCGAVPNPAQRDSNGDGFGNACDADLNNDCFINVVDLGLLRGAFFATGTNLDADFDGDGVVNSADLGVLKLGFFGAPGPSGLVACGN